MTEAQKNRATRSIFKYFLGFIFLYSLTLHNNIQAQDPQYSQYYASPLYLNPALAGISQAGRAGVNYRAQWPSIDAKFETFSAWADYHFEDYNSSAGFIITTDREGLAGLRSTQIGLQYAYQLELTYKWVFRAGTQISYTIRDLNFDKLTFGDQFDETGLINPTTAEQFNSDFKVSYADIALGGVLFSDRLWIGFAMHNITEPNQSFLDGESNLPRRLSLHGGYKIPLPVSGFGKGQNAEGRERSITPTFNWRSQGDFDQLDIGLYTTLEPVIFGLWYRGVPVKRFEDFPNNESIVFMVGLNKNAFTFGYSFDYTLSELGISTGGAHEVSFIYNFSFADPRKPPKEARQLRCPVPFIF